LAEQQGPVICGNLDCKVAIDGKCVEGLALDKCPHYGQPPEVPEDTAPSAETPRTVTGVPLPSGDMLADAGASAVRRAGDNRVIAVIGPKDSGKTTLIASVYELFQMGPVGQCRFAGCQTLYAFERACHHSRAVSLRQKPATERTLVKGVHFYHLGMRVDGADDVLDLVLADRAGEEYREATNDVTAAGRFPEIVRAHVVTMLVDGAGLLKLAVRAHLLSEIGLILQALVDGGSVEGRPKLAIVLTKNDEVIKSSDRQRAEQDFDGLVRRVGAQFGVKLGTIRAFKVAACPGDAQTPRGQGVSDLLDFWREPVARTVESVPPLAVAPSRFMSRMHGGAE
jgi:hypothetical protein